MTTIASNTVNQTAQNLTAEAHPSRIAPFLMLMARPVLALTTQAITILVFMLIKVQSPTIAVRNWWTVYGTLIDLGCLALLFWLVKREGIHLLDLVAFDRTKLKTDILIGLAIFAVVFPITVFGGGMLASLLAYGTLQPDFPVGGFTRTLPLLAVLFSRLFWWILWSFTEELTFQGYCLPRLQVLTKHTWLSIALVTFSWSIQHSFLPWINLQHAFYLFITFVPLTIALQCIYLRVRRLTPLIIGHWLMDLASVLFMLLIG
jgi:membrane protease YdiL (CAAX protease family)